MVEPDKQHEEYKEFLPVWQKCRAAYIGDRAIKKGGKEYLPALSGQSDSDYLKYQNRAVYFNATGRTVEGMTGLVFRKQPVVKAESVKPWLEDITLANETLFDFSETCLTETMVVGRAGILVDMPPSTNAMTQAQAEKIAARPYFTLYKAESIVNWKQERINNVYKLKNLWLQEYYENDKGEQKIQIRQLTLDKGFYEQIEWRSSDASSWVEYKRIMPVKNGQAFKDIPFFPLAPRKPTISVSAPPIESLAELNIAHYRNSADIENAAHIAGIPTPWANNVDNTNPDGSTREIYLGSTTMLLFPQDTTVGFLQCGSEGFATIENLMDRKQEQMAALGARIVAPEKKDAETAETAQIRRGGENSVLGSIANVVSRQITAALKFAAEWAGLSGEISFELNKDYFPTQMTAQEMTAWVSAVQSGAVSSETFFEALKQGEMVSETLTYDDEQTRKENDPPALGTLTDEPQAQD